LVLFHTAIALLVGVVMLIYSCNKLAAAGAAGITGDSWNILSYLRIAAIGLSSVYH
jgi:hypothetical protein